MFGVWKLSSTYLAFDIAARDDLDEEVEDLGDEDDLCFLRFCFLGILGNSVGGMSPNISHVVCPPSLSTKSTNIAQKRMRLGLSTSTEKVVLKFKVSSRWQVL